MPDRPVKRWINVQATAIFTPCLVVMALTAANAAQSYNKMVKIDSGMIEGAVSGGVLSFKAFRMRRRR